jgi:hypothetical protein
MLSHRGVQFYPLLGTGVYHLRQFAEVFVTRENHSTEWGVVAGAGIRFRNPESTSPLGFGVEWRWHDIPNADNYASSIEPLDSGAQFWDATAHLSIGFGH